MYKPIAETNGVYAVNEEGRVIRTERPLAPIKPGVNHKGYIIYYLSVNGKRICRTAHRLVAEAFIPNPNMLPCINHIDENKKNNNVSNLEWCTHKYNTNYSKYRFSEHYKQLAIIHKEQLSKAIIQLSRTGKYIAEHESVIEASRQTNINRGNICSALNGKRLSAGGYCWKYKEDKINAEI